MDQDMLPGMPDTVARVRNGAVALPPRAVAYRAMTLDQAIEHAHEIMDEALRRWPQALERVVLFSGGGDSTILTHLVRRYATLAGHIRTGIAAPATYPYVQAVTAAWGLELRAVGADPDMYRQLVLGQRTATTGPNAGRVVWSGFPGAYGHTIMYRMLKERPLRALRRDLLAQHGRTRGRRGDLLLLSGVRWGESQRRWRNAVEFEPDGAAVFVSPIVWFTNAHMREYRRRYQCNRDHEHAAHRLCFPDALPISEVSEHLHASGDCFCGAFAHEGELEEIAFFYPELAAHIRDLEQQARRAGISRCVWGARDAPGQSRAAQAPGLLCSSCTVGTLFEGLEV